MPAYRTDDALGLEKDMFLKTDFKVNLPPKTLHSDPQKPMVFAQFSLPRRVQSDQKSIKNQAKTGQDRPRQPKTGQDRPGQANTSSKTGPRQALEASQRAKTAPRGSKTAPRRPQEASKKRIPPIQNPDPPHPGVVLPARRLPGLPGTSPRPIFG